jgi:hypothetical protein
MMIVIGFYWEGSRIVAYLKFSMERGIRDIAIWTRSIEYYGK